MIHDNRSDYGWLTITLHWLMALAIFGLFVLGLWMVELDYYDRWYNKAPDIHRSVGVCVVLLWTVRLLWRLSTPTPAPLPGLARWERRASVAMHWCFYLLVPAVATAGYLLSTADGRGVVVFELFEVPATVTGIDNQEDLAGDIHLWLAVVLIGLATLHGAAALKHHFIDRDRTLKRMCGIRDKE